MLNYIFESFTVEISLVKNDILISSSYFMHILFSGLIHSWSELTFKLFQVPISSLSSLNKALGYVPISMQVYHCFAIRSIKRLFKHAFPSVDNSGQIFKGTRGILRRRGQLVEKATFSMIIKSDGSTKSKEKTYFNCRIRLLKAFRKNLSMSRLFP